MPARLVRSSGAENLSTTLSNSISDVATTVTVASVTNINAPCYAVIDRVDANGNRKATSLWEYVYISAIAGSDLTVTRAQGGSTGQSHSAGATLELLPTAALWEDFYAGWILEHSAVPGAHISLASLSYLRSIGVVVSSIASIAQINATTFSVADLAITSTASVRIGIFTTQLNASGASTTVSDLTVLRYLNASGASVLGTTRVSMAQNTTAGAGATTSTTFVDIPNASITLVPTATAQIAINVSGQALNSNAGADMQFRIIRDTTARTNTRLQTDGANTRNAFGITAVDTGIAAGSYVYKVQQQTDVGTVTAGDVYITGIMKE